MKNKLRYLTLLLLLLSAVRVNAQKVIDEVIAVVGDEMIMRSETEAQLQQMRDLKEGADRNEIKCAILQQIMQRKVLLARSKADSLKVTDEQIESELGRRIDYFINQPGVGSAEKLEQYYNKSIAEIKNELRRSIKEQLLADQMQNKVIGGADVTPGDVKKFYNSIPKDSLPYYNTEVEAYHFSEDWKGGKASCH